MPVFESALVCPEFSNYVYHAMASASPEDRKNLSQAELAHFTGPKGMRRFADTKNLDRRLMLLAKLNIPWCLTLMPLGTDAEPVFSEVITQSKYASKRMTIIKAMQEKRIFVLSSRDVMMGAHLAAQNSTSPAYQVGYQYARFGAKFKKLHDRLPANATFSGLQQAQEGFSMLSRVMTKAMGALELAGSINGLTPFQQKVLLAMYGYRNTFVAAGTMAEQLGETSKAVAQCCGILESRGFVAREPGYQTEKKTAKNKKASFTIIEKGITAVAKYLKYVVHNVPLDEE